MTIVEHAPYSIDLEAPQPITAEPPLVEQIAEPASAPADEQTRPSRLQRWTAFGQRRRYNHPRREQFVEEAAMSREMFRL
jgi:hypothetical protein